MVKIKSVKAREILDSRGNPTVETKIVLERGVQIVASVPSGASLGKYEAVELRDNDLKRFHGRGVLKAVANINEILGPSLEDKNPTKQISIDKKLADLDGTDNKSKLGANAILAVSIAVCKAGAAASRMPLYEYIGSLYGLVKKELALPVPIFNLINGGKHGAGNLDFQEFFVIPHQQQKFSRSLQIGEEIYQSLKQVLIKHKAIHSVGDEGGFAPNLFTNLDAFEILKEAIIHAGFEIKKHVLLGLDVAASNFFEGGKYQIRDRTIPITTDEFVDFYFDLSEQFPLMMLEDPFHEDDWSGWKKIMSKITEVMIVGDDLLATNIDRLKKAVRQKACSAAIVKPNQIGTVSESLAFIRQARKADWKIIASHRSGETNDYFMADFAVGVGADLVKFGAPARGERVAKYNRLLAIEESLYD